MKKLLIILLGFAAITSCNSGSNSSKQAVEKQGFDTLYAGYAGMHDLNSKDWPYCEYDCILNDWGTLKAEIHKYVFNNKVIYIDTVPGQREDFEMYRDSYLIKKVGEGRWIVSYKRYLKDDKTFEISASE